MKIRQVHSEHSSLDPGGDEVLTERTQRLDNQPTRGKRTLVYPVWSYVLVGLMFLGLLTWFFTLITLRTIHQLSYWTTSGWFVGWGWGAITTIALAWAVVNVRWAKNSLLELRVVESYAHWAIALCCGVATLGLHYISFQRSCHEGPQIIDPNSLLPIESSEESLAGPIFGKVNRGKAWFALTCVTCHGPTGDGINNLAPSLKASEFLKTADAVEVNLLIRRGRLATDPQNKSGKPMPPRGADPTITDEKVADLVAFVMLLHDRTADPETLSWEGIASSPPTLSVNSLMTRSQNSSVRSTNLTALTVHALFVGGVIIGSLHLLVGWTRGWPTRRCRPWIFVNSWGWNLAFLGWLVTIFFLGMVDSTMVDWFR